ncbi:MAG: hypothetical protein JXX14_20565 [Deltaproteobacteria bacterium]|nr:hypothetical protein [Deltaproteobacteria bacterium]
MARKKIENKTQENKDHLDPSKDEFVQRSMSFLDWAVERRKAVGLLLGTALAAWVGVIVYNHLTEQKIQDASKLLADGLEVSLAPIAGDDDSAPLDEDVMSYKSKDDRAKEAVKRLDKAIQDTAKTPVASAARLAKAAALIDEGRQEEAIKIYQECAQDPNLKVFKESVLAALAQAYESIGKNDDAQKTYQQLADESIGRINLWAKVGVATVLKRKGEDLEKAETMLKGVLDEIVAEGEPDSNDYLLVQAREIMLAINPDAAVPEIPAGINPMILQQLMQAQQAGGAAL